MDTQQKALKVFRDNKSLATVRYYKSLARKERKNSQKKTVLNKDLWERLAELSRLHEIQWQWIKGHNAHNENERCDRLARRVIEQYRNHVQKHSGVGNK